MLDTLTKVDASALKEIREEMGIRKTGEVFLLFALGSQFDHLIKQAIEKLGIYCLVADPARVSARDVKKIKPKGIILSGGPVSVYDDPPPFDGRIFDLGIPILGICLGFQLMAQHIGLKVVNSKKREYGTCGLNIIDKASLLFSGCKGIEPVLESHGDKILAGKKLKIIATTENAPVAAGVYKHLWGVQFHPEVTETECGPKIFDNFCFKICGARDRYPAEEAAKRKIKEIRKIVGDRKILLALSGGTDSSVVAYLLKNALKNRNKKQVRAVYIKGIDRPDDEAFVLKYFNNKPWLELNFVDAANDFLKALRGKTGMHEKRVAMRGIYKKILEREAKKFRADFIAQGTIYPDISESGGGYETGAKKARIKLHHNVNLGFSVKELLPLTDCVKDGVRAIGNSLGVPKELLWRHPFPGPGLIVRIEGEVDKQKLKTARALDGIFIEELRSWKLYDTVWQAGAVLTRSMTTWSKGDGAGSGFVVALWAIWSTNAFTFRAAELPYDFLKLVSKRIANEVTGIGAVVYRTSDKPPATVEWG